MTRTILLEADELADAYALRTLYDYLKFNRFEEKNRVKVAFTDNSSEFSETVLKDCEFNEEDISSDDLLIRPHSDILKSSCDYCINFKIDISILKNCAMFLSYEEKLRLRWKYKIDSNKPVLVVSYADCDESNVKTLVSEVNKLSEIYLIGDMPTKRNAKVVKKYGVLKNYYAMADAAVNAKNLTPTNDVMHNFVEATEGGPLFMVPPTPEYRRQFGYKQLSRKKLIRNCRSFDDLLNKLVLYLDRPMKEIIEEKREHLGKRARYIARARNKYLPEIESVIEKILHKESKTLDSGLMLDTNHYLLDHPETNWECGDR